MNSIYGSNVVDFPLHTCRCWIQSDYRNRRKEKWIYLIFVYRYIYIFVYTIICINIGIQGFLEVAYCYYAGTLSSRYFIIRNYVYCVIAVREFTFWLYTDDVIDGVTHHYTSVELIIFYLPGSCIQWFMIFLVGLSEFFL